MSLSFSGHPSPAIEVTNRASRFLRAKRAPNDVVPPPWCGMSCSLSPPHCLFQLLLFSLAPVVSAVLSKVPTQFCLRGVHLWALIACVPFPLRRHSDYPEATVMPPLSGSDTFCQNSQKSTSVGRSVQLIGAQRVWRGQAPPLSDICARAPCCTCGALRCPDIIVWVNLR